MKYKNSPNQSMGVEAKIEVILGATDWEEHKEMFHILDLGANYTGAHICKNLLN